MSDETKTESKKTEDKLPAGVTAVEGEEGRYRVEGAAKDAVYDRATAERVAKQLAASKDADDK